MSYWPLLGIALVVLGFALKLNPMLVVTAAAIVTGLLGGMDLVEVISTFGKAFNDNRIIAIVWIVLPVIGLLERFGLLGKVPVAGLAKQNEELFVPGRPSPILLPRNSQGLYLVQRVRDEAHRFAITSHRKRRANIAVASRLDAVPGIGPARRKALMARFGSLKRLRAASIDEIAEVPGIGPATAAAIAAAVAQPSAAAPAVNTATGEILES